MNFETFVLSRAISKSILHVQIWGVNSGVNLSPLFLSYSGFCISKSNHNIKPQKKDTEKSDRIYHPQKIIK